MHSRAVATRAGSSMATRSPEGGGASLVQSRRHLPGGVVVVVVVVLLEVIQEPPLMALQATQKFAMSI